MSGSTLFPNNTTVTHNTPTPAPPEDERHEENDYGERDMNGAYYDESNCQVSNDPPGTGDTAKLNICNTKEYLCIGNGSNSTAADGDDSPEGIVVPYEYEILYNTATPSTEIVGYLEEAMLEHIATAMGVRHCKTSTRRRRRAQT